MRRLGLLVLTLILIALPAVADEGLPQPIQMVAGVLQLAPDQILSLVQMIQQREQTLQPLRLQLEQHRRAVGEALQSASPDAQMVGQILIETRNLEQQIGAINNQGEMQFEQVLTPDQRERLHGIRAAAQVCPVIPAFAAAGLL